MLPFFRGVFATCAAFILAFPALAQSKDDIAAKIESALPSTGRGQITGANLRDVLKTFNGARGQPGGIAELTSEGRLADAQAPKNLTAPNFLGIGTAQAFRLSGIGPLDSQFQSTPNPDAIQFSPGMGVAYCPGLACIPGITDRNQRASMVVSGSTQLDGEAEEQLLALSMTTKTGKLTNWTANTVYPAGLNVLGSGDNVYRVAANCTSGASMPVLPDQNNPKGAVVTNGSCQLKWINRGAIAAKLTAYFENEVEPGAGNAWTQANNFIMRPGAPTNFNINTEMDFSNISGTDCQLGQNCTALRLGMGGPNKATQALDITTDNTPNFKTIWGIRLNGLNLASEALIGLDSNSKYGIAANQLGLGGDTFTGGLILDNSKSPASLIITNQKTEASIIDSSPGSGATLVTSNSRNSYDLGLGATAPIGVALNGTYGTAAVDARSATIANQGGFPTALVMKEGQQACWAGFNVCWRYEAATQRMKLRWNGQDVASIDSTGAARFLGAVTGNVTP